MTEAEAIQIVHRRGLYVSAGPHARPATDRRKGALVSWVVAAEAAGSDRGLGETIELAVQNLVEQETQRKTSEDSELM